MRACSAKAAARELTLSTGSSQPSLDCWNVRKVLGRASLPFHGERSCGNEVLIENQGFELRDAPFRAKLSTGGKRESSHSSRSSANPRLTFLNESGVFSDCFSGDVLYLNLGLNQFRRGRTSSPYVELFHSRIVFFLQRSRFAVRAGNGSRANRIDKRDFVISWP